MTGATRATTGRAQLPLTPSSFMMSSRSSSSWSLYFSFIFFILLCRGNTSSLRNDNFQQSFASPDGDPMCSFLPSVPNSFQSSSPATKGLVPVSSMLTPHHQHPETTTSLKPPWISGKSGISVRISMPTAQPRVPLLPAHLLAPFDGLRGWGSLVAVGSSCRLGLCLCLLLLLFRQLRVLRVVLLLLFLHFSKENNHRILICCDERGCCSSDSNPTLLPFHRDPEGLWKQPVLRKTSPAHE